MALAVVPRSVGFNPLAICTDVVMHAPTLASMGCTRSELWKGSTADADSFLFYGPFTKNEAEGIPVADGAYIPRGFFESVFLSFVDHHKKVLPGKVLVPNLRVAITEVPAEDKFTSAPRLPFATAEKCRHGVLPGFKSYVPLWACVAEGRQKLPKIPASKTYVYDKLFWKKEHRFKLLKSAHSDPAAVAQLELDAFRLLSELIRKEITNDNTVAGLVQLTDEDRAECSDEEDITWPVTGSAQKRKKTTPQKLTPHLQVRESESPGDRDVGTHAMLSHELLGVRGKTSRDNGDSEVCRLHKEEGLGNGV